MVDWDEWACSLVSGFIRVTWSEFGAKLAHGEQRQARELAIVKNR